MSAGDLEELDRACDQLHEAVIKIAKATGHHRISILASVTVSVCAAAGVLPWLIDCINRVQARQDDRGALQ